MKERYETRIKEIEEEKQSLEEQEEERDQLVPKLKEEIKKLQSQGGSGDRGDVGDSQTLLNEVRKFCTSQVQIKGIFRNHILHQDISCIINA